MEDLFTCPQCKSAFADPRLLPCHHTLCLACVEQIHNSRQPKDRVCPVDNLTLPFNLSPEDLPQNLSITTLATLFSKTTPSATGSALCPNCKERVVSHWCKDCSVLYEDLCEACMKKIHSNTVLKHHSIITLQEKKRTSIIPKCMAHESKATDLYCPECKKLVCSFCDKASHSTHKCIPFLEASKRLKDTLKSNLTLFLKRKETLQKAIVKKREEVKTSEAKKSELLSVIEKIEKEIIRKNKEIHRDIQQFNQTETIYSTLIREIDSQNNIEILDQRVFQETASRFGSLYKAVFPDAAFVATFNLESKSPKLEVNSNCNIISASGAFSWGSITGSVTSAQSFVWKFRVNQITKCYIGLVSPVSLAQIKTKGYPQNDGFIGLYQGCIEVSNNNRTHLNCPGWKVNDVFGLELDFGTLRFYHNDVVVKEMEFTQLDYVPVVALHNSNLTLITE